jgi:hypothetical protein
MKSFENSRPEETNSSAFIRANLDGAGSRSDNMLRSALSAVPAPDLFLPFGFDQLQHTKLLLRDVGQRDCESNALCVQNAEASPHQSAVRRVHRFFEAVFRTAWPVAHVDRLPIRTAGGAPIQLRRRRVPALPAAEDTVGAVFLPAAQCSLLQHRPDEEAYARIFRPVAGRGYFSGTTGPGSPGTCSFRGIARTRRKSSC